MSFSWLLSSRCVSCDCFFKMSCSFISVTMVAIHRVHSHHCHWSMAIITVFSCMPRSYTLSILYSLFQEYMQSRLWSANCCQFLLGGFCCMSQVSWYLHRTSLVMAEYFRLELLKCCSVMSSLSV